MKKGEEKEMGKAYIIDRAVKKNKTNAVLKHLKVMGSITSMEAFELYGATRLSAIIFSLRKKRYNIETNDGTCIDRFGHRCNFARYTLIED
jgi:hypothetical protein